MEDDAKKYDSYIILNNNKNSLSKKTRKDLNIENLFNHIDYTSSCIGKQYLYHILCTDKKSNVNEHEEFIEKLTSSNDLRNDLIKQLKKLSNPNAYSIVDILSETPHTYSKNYILLLQICRWLPAISLCLLFIIKTSYVPFILLIISYIFNGYLHFQQKNILSCYFFSIPQLYKLITVAKTLSTNHQIQINNNIEPSISKLSQLQSKLKRFRIDISLESEAAMLFYLFSELFNIFTLNSTINIVNSFILIQKQKKEIEDIFRYVGFLDTLCSISILREKTPYYCIPNSNKENERLYAHSVYHPLINGCIENDIQINNKSALITGTNMAGKTSFIRTVAINVLCGKVLNTCFAKEFRVEDIKIYTAIHTNDELTEGKSYFFKEAENINEILNKHNDKKYLIILDEIFKGTNPTERLAINASIHSALADMGHIILSSSHEQQLINFINDKYDLYHFSEIIIDGELQFDYKLRSGTSKEGNAIKILQILGYPQEIINYSHNIVKQIKNNNKQNNITYISNH